MKRLLLGLMLMLLAVGTVSAGEVNTLSVQFRDSLGGDDTTAIYRFDTVYTPRMDIRGMNWISFYTYFDLGPYDVDSDFVEDTCIVLYQTSFDTVKWLTAVPIDTFELGVTTQSTYTDSTAAISTILLNTTSTASGPYLRGMFVIIDSLEAEVALQDRVFTRQCHIDVLGRR